MIDLHADDVESDEEPPELTDSESNDSDVSDYALERKVCTALSVSQSICHCYMLNQYKNFTV